VLGVGTFADARQQHSQGQQIVVQTAGEINLKLTWIPLDRLKRTVEL